MIGLEVEASSSALLPALRGLHELEKVLEHCERAGTFRKATQINDVGENHEAPVEREGGISNCRTGSGSLRTGADPWHRYLGGGDLDRVADGAWPCERRQLLLSGNCASV